MFCLDIFQFYCDLLVGLHVGTEEDLPERAAPQLAADAEPVADARLHGCGKRVDGDDPGNQQMQTEPAMR